MSQPPAARQASGCDANDDHHGVALFVNEWNTNSGQLYLSWGNARSGRAIYPHPRPHGPPPPGPDAPPSEPAHR